MRPIAHRRANGEAMTPLELAKQALDQWSAATPGPWHSSDSGGIWYQEAMSRHFVASGYNPADWPAIAAARTREPQLAQALIDLHRLRPIETWHEDYGPVLWWRLPIAAPPWCGTPNDDDWPLDGADIDGACESDIYTHWSPLPDGNWMAP